MGRVHSFQSLGGADGPGLRYVVFMQGCPLRCVYCHNPDALDFTAGSEFTPREVFERVRRCKPYFINGGGVTLSGGEPLMQPEFAAELFGLLHDEGIHTAVDTSGTCNLDAVKPVLENTDLVICDIKFTDEALYKQYTGGSLNKVLGFLELTQQLGITLWVRNVIVPGLTDSPHAVKRTVEIATQYSNLQRIELLPFRKLCIAKYKQAGIPFALSNTPECTPERLCSLYELVPPDFRPR